MCNSCRLWRALKALHQSEANRRERNSNIRDDKKAEKKSCRVTCKVFFALRKKEREVFIEYERKLSNTFMFAKAFAIFCHCCVEGWWHCANIDWEVYVRLEMALRIQFLLPSSQFLSLPTASLSSPFFVLNRITITIKNMSCRFYFSLPQIFLVNRDFITTPLLTIISHCMKSHSL